MTTTIASALLVLGLAANPLAAPKPPAPKSPPAKLDKTLKEQTTKTTATLVSLIATMEPGHDLPRDFKKYARGGKIGIINGYALDGMPAGLLSALAEYSDIHRLHYNRSTKGHDLRSSVALHAQTSDGTRAFPYTGAGVTVAILDSGFTRQPHPDMTDDRIAAFVDFVGKDKRFYDGNGHGTHVSGVIGGTGTIDARFGGMAPDASILSLKVLDADGRGSIADVIQALDWIANHPQYGIRVVNMSVGADVSESYWTDPLTLATKALVDRGITVVAAAGNLGQDDAGNLQWGGITAPGNAPWVLTACAFNTKGTLSTADDVLADFSSAGPTAVDFDAKPDVCAPGVGIVSLADPGSTLYQDAAIVNPNLLLDKGVDPHYPASPYMSLTGTSQATPFVTGTVALMLEANPNLTPNLIKAILEYTATPQPGVDPLRQGAGFMNTDAAVRLAAFYASGNGAIAIDPSWSQTFIWNGYLVSGGVIDPTASAWQQGVAWGTGDASGTNIVWGTSCEEACEVIVWASDGTASGTARNIVWGTSRNIVWGTARNIVWGTARNIVWGTARNIVWGTSCGGANCTDVVVASDAASDSGDETVLFDRAMNTVWGNSRNIVWGTARNIVWGTSDAGHVVWDASNGKGKGR